MGSGNVQLLTRPAIIKRAIPVSVEIIEAR